MRQGDDPPVAVDHRRDAHVHRPYQRPPRFDRPEAADGQVFLVFARAHEPTVIRQVDEEIDRRPVTRPGIRPR